MGFFNRVGVLDWGTHGTVYIFLCPGLPQCLDSNPRVSHQIFTVQMIVKSSSLSCIITSYYWFWWCQCSASLQRYWGWGQGRNTTQENFRVTFSYKMDHMVQWVSVGYTCKEVIPTFIVPIAKMNLHMKFYFFRGPHHRRKLPIIPYHKIMVIYPYLFFLW